MATSYSALVSAVKSTAENESTEFAAQIDNFIDRAQYRIHRDLDPFGFVSVVYVTVASADPYLVKPSAALVPNHLYRLSGTRREPMIMRTDEFINEYWPDRTSTGTPKYYANWGAGTYLIAPAASATTTFEFSITLVPEALNTTTSTNWLTEYAPELFFYAIMVEANKFMKNWGAMKLWEEDYQRAATTIREEARRNRRDDNSHLQTAPGENNIGGRT